MWNNKNQQISSLFNLQEVCRRLNVSLSVVKQLHRSKKQSDILHLLVCITYLLGAIDKRLSQNVYHSPGFVFYLLDNLANEFYHFQVNTYSWGARNDERNRNLRKSSKAGYENCVIKVQILQVARLWKIKENDRRGPKMEADWQFCKK